MPGREPMPGYDDVLDTGTRTRFGPRSALGAIAVVALLGWQLRTSPVPPVVSAPLEVAAPAEAVPETVIEQWDTDVVTEVTFVDGRSGFAVQEQCSPSAGAGSGCGRRLLSTSDAGVTWDSLRWIPTLADGYDELLAVSVDELMLLDTATLSGVVRSTDGGQSWVRLPVRQADSRPLAPSSVVVMGAPVICNRQCERTSVAWFDPISLTVHPVPAQPTASELTRSQFTRATTAGADVLVSGTTLTGAYAAFSRDGGRSWSEARLDPDLASGQAVVHSEVTPAGDGRAYAYVQVTGRTGESTTFRYRSDDGGANWLPLPVPSPDFLWSPLAVLAGELLVNDDVGRTYLSSGGGTSWVEVTDAPVGMSLAQTAPDAPIVGTVWRLQSAPQRYLSRDGLSWLPVRLST